MNKIFKGIASRLPISSQQRLKRAYFAHQIGKGTFVADDYEFGLLKQWIRPGDWVIDIGANIGHYTKELSDLVGDGGRVIAVEPVPHTFDLLVANASRFKFRNVTFLNVAASNKTAIVRMEVPQLTTGLDNYYMAQINENATSGFGVVTLALDSIAITQPIRVIKIDVEGHELLALQGLVKTLGRDHPTLIVEGADKQVEALLRDLDYDFTYQPGSPNRVYFHRKGL